MVVEQIAGMVTTDGDLTIRLDGFTGKSYLIRPH